MCGWDSEGQEGAQGMLRVWRGWPHYPEIGMRENRPNTTVFRVPVTGPRVPSLPCSPSHAPRRSRPVSVIARTHPRSLHCTLLKPFPLPRRPVCCLLTSYLFFKSSSRPPPP